MLNITATNYKGDSLVLSPSDAYFIEKITGLGPATATITTAKLAKHGTVYNSATKDQRNIVFYLTACYPAGENRRKLYQAFPPGLPVALRFKDGDLDVTIEGYTENTEPDAFVQGPTVQISVICPDPFYKREAQIIAVTSEAPAVLTSSCPFETGYHLTATFTAEEDSFSLMNAATGETLTIAGPFAAGDILEIDTATRTRRIIINGANGYNSKAPESPWAMLAEGENSLTVTAGCTCEIKFIDRLDGI